MRKLTVMCLIWLAVVACNDTSEKERVDDTSSSNSGTHTDRDSVIYIDSAGVVIDTVQKK